MNRCEGDPKTFALYSFPFDALGTACLLHLYAGSADEAESIATAAIDEVMRIELRYSRYLDESTLSAINRAAAAAEMVVVDEETAALLDYAIACYRKSDGLFDITSGILRKAWNFNTKRLPETAEIQALQDRVGMDKLKWHRPYLGFEVPGIELDFGGMGKEYAADRVADVCAEHGIRHGLVDLGGDIRVFGPHADGSSWRVGISDPRNPEQALCTVDLRAGALATSGDYERFIEIDGQRYGHILNPHTGWPIHEFRSVSVCADQCLLAGSLSTIGMLKGAAGKAWLASIGFDHLWVDQWGNQGGTLNALIT